MTCVVCRSPHVMPSAKDLNGCPKGTPICGACLAAVGRREVGIVRTASGGYTVTDGRRFYERGLFDLPPEPAAAPEPPRRARALLAPDTGAARRTDPDTSHEAAASIKASHFEAFWLALLAERPGGVTAFEVAEASHQRLNSISPRSATLKRKGLIADSGERRYDPTTNRRSIVWVKAS